MKTEVTVNGITLTRGQVEDALKELNTPVVEVFKGGDLVQTRYQTSTYVILRAEDAEIVETAKQIKLGKSSTREWAVSLADGHLAFCYKSVAGSGWLRATSEKG